MIFVLNFPHSNYAVQMLNISTNFIHRDGICAFFKLCRTQYFVVEKYSFHCISVSLNVM